MGVIILSRTLALSRAICPTTSLHLYLSCPAMPSTARHLSRKFFFWVIMCKYSHKKSPGVCHWFRFHSLNSPDRQQPAQKFNHIQLNRTSSPAGNKYKSIATESELYDYNENGVGQLIGIIIENLFNGSI